MRHKPLARRLGTLSGFLLVTLLALFIAAPTQASSSATGSWTSVVSTATARRNSAATLLQNGKILVVGGKQRSAPRVGRTVRPGYEHLEQRCQYEHAADSPHSQSLTQ